MSEFLSEVKALFEGDYKEHSHRLYHVSNGYVYLDDMRITPDGVYFSIDWFEKRLACDPFAFIRSYLGSKDDVSRLHFEAGCAKDEYEDKVLDIINQVESILKKHGGNNE